MALFSRRPPDSKTVLSILDQLRSKLDSALGDHLTALILHGDFARPRSFVPGQSSIDLLMVLDDVSTDVLNLAVAPLKWARWKLPLSVMTMTELDLNHSCDVFPIRFVEMQENHRLLYGKDVLADLQIADSHLRLRCEQELRNLSTRLRTTYLNNSGSPKALRAAMIDSVGHVLRLLSMALTLKSGVSPDEPHEILQAAQGEFNLPVEVLQATIEARTSNAKGNATTFNAYMKCVQAAARAVDELEVRKSTGDSANSSPPSQ